MSEIEKLTDEERHELETNPYERTSCTMKAARIIDAQTKRITELQLEFDRIYCDARSAAMKLDVSVKRGEARPAREYERLAEQVERLRPLFEEIRSRS